MQEPVRRWLAPIAIGLAFGAVYFGLDSWTKFTALTNAHHGVATTQFVGVAPSILIFTGGAIISYAVFCLKKKKILDGRPFCSACHMHNSGRRDLITEEEIVPVPRNADHQ